MADTAKLQPAHCQLVEALKNKVASWTHLQCHSQSYTEKNLKSQVSSAASHHAISSHVFPTSFQRNKNKMPSLAEMWVTSCPLCPHSRCYSHSDGAPAALTSVHGCIWIGSLQQFRLIIHHHNHQEELILTQIIAVIPLGFCSDGI